VAAGIVLLVGLGWWLMRQARHGRRAGNGDAIAATSPAPGMGLSASATGGPQGGSAVLVTTPTPTPVATPEPTPTPTPTPEPSYIVVPAAWSGDVWVTVGKQPRRRLDKDQRFVVTADTPTTLRFGYESAGYQDDAQRTVRVGEGQTTRVVAPIQRPGLIQVQQKLGTPLGRVVLDGVGPPIVRHRARPGGHRVRIDPLSGAGVGIPEQQVELPPGKKLVVTFDLASGRLQAVPAELPAP
jgi:hypothetical protein